MFAKSPVVQPSFTVKVLDAPAVNAGAVLMSYAALPRVGSVTEKVMTGRAPTEAERTLRILYSKRPAADFRRAGKSCATLMSLASENFPTA